MTPTPRRRAHPSFAILASVLTDHTFPAQWTVYGKDINTDEETKLIISKTVHSHVASPRLTSWV